MFLIFINVEIAEKLEYISGLQPVTSLKSELLHRYLMFLFFARTSLLKEQGNHIGNFFLCAPQK